MQSVNTHSLLNESPAAYDSTCSYTVVPQDLRVKVTAQLAELQQQLEEGRTAVVQAAADKAALTAKLAAADRAKGKQWVAVGLSVWCSCWLAGLLLPQCFA